jgi:hypothetical protein
MSNLIDSTLIAVIGASFRYRLSHEVTLSTRLWSEGGNQSSRLVRLANFGARYRRLAVRRLRLNIAL